MADGTVLVTLPQLKPIRIVKWKVNPGYAVSIGRVILLYHFEGVQEAEHRKLKSTQAGTVLELLAPEGAIVSSGEPLLRLKGCIHPTVMKDMCAECGADLRKEEASRTASVPMVHSIPELKVSEEVAQKLGKADGERLIRDRKLVLLVDLDQTLIHTTNDNIQPNLKDVYHFQLYGPNSAWYHTRLRPGTHNFLKNMSKLFELHICTFGARNYAHMIALFLDSDQAYFANRILSRDECFDPTSKKANLKALFPCGDDMVCIIDDREDVWNHASNLIHVKPYHFFQHTGDINAPPGLDKHEADSREGVDLRKLKNTTKLNGNSGKCVTEQAEAEKKENGVNSKEMNTVLNTIEEEEKKEVEVNGESGEVQSKAVEDDKVAADVETDSNAFSVVAEPKNAEDSTEERAQDPPSPPPTDASSVEPESTTPEKEREDAETKLEESEPEAKSMKSNDEDLKEVEDPDDYLLYLEDILKLVHRRFYEEYDRLQSGNIPDLKIVIPAVRSEILKGCRLVFSGLVPTQIKLEQSKAYQVARSLGAVVTQDIDDNTTHLVAVRPGTAKVNAGRRKKNLKIVTPDWLWACAERWEHIEEAIYPLSNKGSKNRHPPPHCSSPEHVPNYPTHEQPAVRKRTPSGRFMDTINPLMSFSSDDIADMDKEVEDILDDDDSDSEQGEISEGAVGKSAQSQGSKEKDALKEGNLSSSSSSSSVESLTNDFARGYKRHREEEKVDDQKSDELQDGEDSTTLDDIPSAKFRRGEDVGSDLDNSNSGSDLEPEDDGEWNMMGAALEREFLSNN